MNNTAIATKIHPAAFFRKKKKNNRGCFEAARFETGPFAARDKNHTRAF
jgi:hypothetical protein